MEYSYQEAHWLDVTIIDDDDLMFGGKPLSVWHEEDRRNSVGEESTMSHDSNASSSHSPSSSISSISSDAIDEHRGRTRLRGFEKQ